MLLRCSRPSVAARRAAASTGSRASVHTPSSKGTSDDTSSAGAALAADTCDCSLALLSLTAASSSALAVYWYPAHASSATVNSVLAATTPLFSHARRRSQRRLVPASPASPSTTSRSSRVTKYERPLGRAGGNTRCARPSARDNAPSARSIGEPSCVALVK